MADETLQTTTRRSDGERTHAAILGEAMRLASIEGVHGLTIGRLAEALGVSKSGLYAHFGSKERLQLETIEAARGVFDEEVMRPALESAPGLPQLEAVIERFFSYLERGVFPGGCFFAGLLAEVDARSGRIHDLTAAWEREWLDEMAALVIEAQRVGQVPPDVDPHQVTFELYACMELTNYHFVLFKDPSVVRRGRDAVGGIVDRAKASVTPRRRGAAS